MHSSGEIFLLTELIVFMTLARSVHLRNVVSRNSRYHRTVHDLIQELQVPPKWILYQKQPETLRIHEVVFNSTSPSLTGISIA